MKFNKVDFYTAIEEGNEKKTKHILNNGFQMDDKTGEWSLFLAIKNNNFNAAKLLKQKGAKIRSNSILKAKNLFLENVESSHDKAAFKVSLMEIFPHNADEE